MRPRSSSVCSGVSKDRGEHVFMRYLIVVIAAVVLATVGAAVSVSAAESQEVGTTATVTTCDGKSIELDPREERTLRLHNETRKNQGIKPLCVHPELTRAARFHSDEMIKKDYFRHGNVERRLERFGYNWLTYGENIGMGSGPKGSPESVFKGWMESSGHRANILDKDFREVGIGVATGNFNGTRGVAMYTVDFGTER